MLLETVTIEATPKEIWAVMADVRRWPEWLPTVASLRATNPTAPDDEGSQYVLDQPGLPEATWTITQWLPSTCFTWETTAPGVRTTATHVLVPGEDGSTEVHLGLQWKGPLAMVANLLYGRLTRRNLEAEAAALARTVAERSCP